MNYDSLPVNKPQCPVHTYNRDGARTVTGSVDRHNHRLDNDYYSQPGNLFRLITRDARERLIGNILASMKSVPRRIQELQIQHFYKADPAYGTGVARGLGIDIEKVLGSESRMVAAD